MQKQRRIWKRTADQRLCFRYTDSAMYLKFQDSNFLLWVYRPVCVGLGRKSQRLVFSCCGSVSVSPVTKNMLMFFCVYFFFFFFFSLPGSHWVVSFTSDAVSSISIILYSLNAFCPFRVLLTGLTVFRLLRAHLKLAFHRFSSRSLP